MFFLSSTIHANHHIQNSENRFIRYSLISIWGLLIFFGFLSFIQPNWLKGISSPGKKSEALEQKNYGDRFLKKGDYRTAISHYKKAIKIQPDLNSAIGNIGISYTQLKLYDKAIVIFKHLLKSDIRYIHTNYYNLAELYKRKGDTESAIKYYIKSAETNPFPIYSYQYLGELYLKLQKWDLAIESFQLALENKLTLENSYYGMLERVEKSSQDEPEILKVIKSLKEIPGYFNQFNYKIFESMLKRDKEIAKTYNFLGYAYARKNNYAEAILNFEKALEIWPNFSEAKNNLQKAIKKN